jgi:predicted nucleic acid-binding protein
MMVIDASAAIEWLLNSSTGRRVRDVLLSAQALAAPHLIDVEIVQTLRRYVRRREITPERGRVALRDLGDVQLNRFPHLPMAERMWELRDNVSAYDAAYVSLAEGLDATLLTCDRKLASAVGLRVRVEVIDH